MNGVFEMVQHQVIDRTLCVDSEPVFQSRSVPSHILIRFPVCLFFVCVSLRSLLYKSFSSRASLFANLSKKRSFVFCITLTCDRDQKKKKEFPPLKNTFFHTVFTVCRELV